jgi:ferredoxin
MLIPLLPRRENSRLSCQIAVADAIDGLKVTIAREE